MSEPDTDAVADALLARGYRACGYHSIPGAFLFQRTDAASDLRLNVWDYAPVRLDIRMFMVDVYVELDPFAAKLEIYNFTEETLLARLDWIEALALAGAQAVKKAAGDLAAKTECSRK